MNFTETLTSKFTQIEKEKLILTRKYHIIKETIPLIYYTREKKYIYIIRIHAFLQEWDGGTNYLSPEKWIPCD